jgi:DNA-binding transcriptional ArsR family regulator
VSTALASRQTVAYRSDPADKMDGDVHHLAEACSRVRTGVMTPIPEHADNPMHWSWMAILTDPVRLELLHALCQLGEATAAELRAHCHTSDPTVRRHLEALEALGLVREHPGERDGLTPGRPARRHVLDAEAAAKISNLFGLINTPLVPTSAPELQPPGDPETGPAPCTPPPAAARAAGPSFPR